MFIELTDHLRCPADHDEAFLVLLPDELDGRSVRTGTLGCPVCDRRFALRDGVLLVENQFALHLFGLGARELRFIRERAFGGQARGKGITQSGNTVNSQDQTQNQKTAVQ